MQQRAADKTPHAKSKAEFAAYQAAVTQTDPAKLEAAAIQFAQRFPGSELRAYLFQRAMGLYQQANHPAKSLEMARAVLKYDPGNPLALLGAAQVLAERTHEEDLDRDARLQEAATDGEGALKHAADVTRPASLSDAQFATEITQLRGAAHEVLGTVAYKQRKYRKAVEEYSAAIAVEKEHIDAVVWLRLAAAHDKLGEYSLGIADAQNAIAASQPGSKAHKLAEREIARLRSLAAAAATRPVAGQPESPRAPGPAN
jgi:tetratricopeptide (TPR) repeat protein